MSVANQRIVFIKRYSDKTTKNFLKVSNENLRSALQRLDEKGFLLWLYFVDNRNDYRMELYPIDFCQWCRLSDSSFRRAWEELIKEGYLVKSKKNKNIFLFREVSANPTNEETTNVKVVSSKEIEEYFPQETIIIEQTDNQTDSQIDNQKDTIFDF